MHILSVETVRYASALRASFVCGELFDGFSRRSSSWGVLFDFARVGALFSDVAVQDRFCLAGARCIPDVWLYCGRARWFAGKAASSGWDAVRTG